ncbi:hypothetical protein Dsin_005444 [Dipteronia sinensis]|uniref:MULE transposase domain-containing protein n=1 Tax=Dipteronia sinensis TaxID=43782 RepID=A0AAE0AXV2_9ROSI|nr:hypothetical protein Dsin_005444 [Dipteronia sinensis]
MIKTLQDKHCCQKVSKNQEANAVWVASRFKILIEEEPDVKASVLAKKILKIYGITIPSYTLYRAKYRVLEKTKLEYSKCYDKLYKYGYPVEERNPGSMAFIRTIVPDLGGLTRFQRFFLSFSTQKAGVLFGCRPFIGLDGCHLKGRHQGVLLSAIAIDANNGVFPLAICIAEGECKESWDGFLSNCTST